MKTAQIETAHRASLLPTRLVLLCMASLIAAPGCSDEVSRPAVSDGGVTADISVKDLAVDSATPDQRLADQLIPDQRLADQLMPDQFVPDQFVPDQFVNDQFVDDQFVPDQFVPDQFVPDQFVPDQFVPDQFVPDQFVPDQFVPDQLVPDHLVPDQQIPDQLIPDQLIPVPANCKQVLAQNSSAPSGVYKVDPDGTGGISPFDVYCDNKTANGGWTLFMFVDSALKSAVTTGTTIDPTKLKGYHYMSHASFKALAKPGMVVRAWGINNPELYYECGFQSAGTTYKSWKAALSCKQRLGLVAGGYKLLNASASAVGFSYGAVYDSINPGNVITANSVYTKIHTNHYATGWDMPGTPGDTWVSSGYKWYYGDWVTSAKYAMVYALR